MELDINTEKSDQAALIHWVAVKWLAVNSLAVSWTEIRRAL